MCIIDGNSDFTTDVSVDDTDLGKIIRIRPRSVSKINSNKPTTSLIMPVRRPNTRWSMAVTKVTGRESILYKRFPIPDNKDDKRPGKDVKR